MPKNLLWKLALIAAVVLVALYFSYPLDRINLGLDLRGGAHILIQVESESTVRYEMDSAQTRIGQALSDKGLGYEAVLVVAPTTLEIRGTDPARSAEVREILDNWLGWEVNSRGSGEWRVTMPPQRRAQLEIEAVDTTLETIRRRVDGLGVSEPLVQKQGLAGDRILVQLPGVENPQRVKDLIIATETLDWKEISYPPSAGSSPCQSNWQPPTSEAELLAEFGGALPAEAQVFPQDIPEQAITLYWPLKRVSVVRGTDLVNAQPSLDEWNTPQIRFELSQDAGRRFEEATRRNIGCAMAIVLGPVEQKYVYSAPTIQGAIRDSGRIMGQFSQQEAEDFALKLRSGAIPTDLTFIEERTVGPSLGHDSIRAGAMSGIAGFMAIMLFMLVYYRLSGINAAVALLLNVVLVFGALGALPFLFAGARATLTLPGIAGLVLTVGMAVDSNVLIFERIREELGLGKTVRAAVEQGFSRAFMTILDCNVTTLVAAFFLFSYGTGPVKGFAVTLTIGLLASMFTAVFVSRQLFEIVLTARKGADTLSI